LKVPGGETETQRFSAAKRLPGNSKRPRPPVNLDSASGSVSRGRHRPIRHHQVRQAAPFTPAILATSARITAASGEHRVSIPIKGDLRGPHSLSGSLNITSPGRPRPKPKPPAASVTVVGNNDPPIKPTSKASSASGWKLKSPAIPSGNSYWHLKTASGSVEVFRSKDRRFPSLRRSPSSGEIPRPIFLSSSKTRTSILFRAHVGTPGGRVEVRTVSGGHPRPTHLLILLFVLNVTKTLVIFDRSGPGLSLACDVWHAGAHVAERPLFD